MPNDPSAPRALATPPVAEKAAPENLSQLGAMTQTEIQGIVGVQTSPTQGAAAPAKATLGPPPATSTATATAALEGCVTAAGLNVRARPSPDAPVVDWLRNGKCYPFDARTADAAWLRLSAVGAKNGQARWAAAKFIALKGDISTLPVAK